MQPRISQQLQKEAVAAGKNFFFFFFFSWENHTAVQTRSTLSKERGGGGICHLRDQHFLKVLFVGQNKAICKVSVL